MTNLELKRRRLKTLGATIEDDDMILHILNNLPKEYETVVELCEEDLSRGKVNLQTVRNGSELAIRDCRRLVTIQMKLWR